MDKSKFITHLKEKYNYGEELLSYLDKLIPALITYYKSEELVYGALDDVLIHIQEPGENEEEYYKGYFGNSEKFEIPFLGGAFHDERYYLDNNKITKKTLIYYRCRLFNLYKPFDFSDDSSLSGLTHEICHAIKSYKKEKIVNGKLVSTSGLIKYYYEYQPENKIFNLVSSENVGIEEALNSYDEAEVMTIMTGEYHRNGSYIGMSEDARKIMENEDIKEVIQLSQLSGGDEWIKYLGEENSKLLIENFDTWVNALYRSPIDLLNNDLKTKVQSAKENIKNFIRNYTSPTNKSSYDQCLAEADKKTVDIINKVIAYDSENNTFEQIEGVSPLSM